MDIETIWNIITLLVIHYVSDFIFQSHKMAINKSSSNLWLAYHVSVYILPFSLLYFIFNNIIATLLFMLINAVAHFLTDYVSSRIAKEFWIQKDMHNFFLVVGADQLAHHIMLILSFYYISSGALGWQL